MKAHTKSWFALIGLVVTALGLIALWPRPAHAAGPWYVAPGGSDSNSCLTPGSPCSTIKGAIGKASSGDAINVATGTYMASTGSEVVPIDKNLTLSGGWNTEFTTQNGMSTIDGGGARRGITVNSSITVTVDRFVVQNSYALWGGGISNAGTLTLNNSTVSDNTSSGSVGYGGGISNTGTLTLNNSTVSGNTNSGFGSVYGGYGGGIYNDGTLTLNNSTVSSNTGGATYGGGGIYNDGTLTLNNSTVNGNTSESDGGGIVNSSTLTLNNSTVSGNTTSKHGGDAIANYGTLTLNNSTVSSNTGGGIYGGGIRNFDGALTLNNSTVSSNTGVGIVNTSYGILTLNNSTVTSNTGGGINGGGTVTLQNSILAGNTGFTSPDCNGTISSTGYNLLGDTSGCTFTVTVGDLTNIDSNLSPLQDNGGPTLTHALLPGSPAVNAGNPYGCMGSAGLLTADQRGLARFGRCDIGAYELQPIGFSTKTVSPTTASHGDPLTYTVTLTNEGVISLTNILVTDTLPISLTYNSNSLTATDGAYGYNSGVITWTGSLNAGSMVTVTFGATVNQATALGTTIVNSAVISGGGEIVTRTATVNVPLAQLFLPLVTRDYCPPYSDNFSNPASGWPVGDDGNIRYEYLNGEYRILVRNTNWWAGARPGVKCSDYAVAVDVRNATGTVGTYGLIYGLSDDWQQFYTFEIAPNGYYYLWRYNGGNWTLLQNGYSPSINTGPGTNRLKIERVGAQIKAYANDQLLTTLSDSTYTGARRVGLIVTSYSQPNVDARFDNFVVCAPGCSGAASLSEAGVTSSGAVNPTTPSSAGATSRGTSESKAIELPAPMPQPEAAPAKRDVWRPNEAKPN